MSLSPEEPVESATPYLSGSENKEPKPTVLIRLIPSIPLPEEINAYVELTARSPLPIAAGEQCTTVWDFRELADKHAVNIVQPDLARCGGITEFMRIEEVTRAAGMWCIPHAWKTGILKAASLHVNAVIPGERLQEWCVEPNALTVDLVEPHLPVINGLARVPRAPGLGIQLNDELVNQLRVG